MDFDEKDVQNIKKFFLKLVNIMEDSGKSKNYADVLLVKEASLGISKDNTEINLDKDEDFGVKLRLFDGERFHVYGVSGFDKALLLKKAKEFSRLKNKNQIRLKIDQKRSDRNFVSRGKINPAEINVAKKAEYLNKLQAKLLADKKIINARVFYMEEQEFKIFVNRYKQLSQNLSLCFIGLMPFVISAEKDTRYYYKSFFSSGFEVTKIDEKQIKNLIKKTLAVSEAKKLRPGRYTCILSPDLAGLLAHESFGHGMESDTIYKGRAKAKEFLGKKIAPASVSIIDNPAFPARHGSFYFDDEGVLAEPTYLIKDGIVRQPITDAYSTNMLDKDGIRIKRTANSRAESYDHKSYARMSNTYFGPGKTPLKKMIKAVKDGLYLHTSSGGMEDPKGWHVQIQGIIAERIKHGKLTGELFYEVGMTGYLPSILGNIRAVGDKLSILGTGSCGKGHKEWVRVSEGGPHLLIKDVELA